MSTIAMVGTGYVGLVSGACLADFGNQVICVDADTAKIAGLERGNIPFFEPGLEAVVARTVAARRLRFTVDVAAAVDQSDMVFIAVGTPAGDDGGVDLTSVEEAVRSIGRSMRRRTIVVDKSTVPVGTGRRVARWLSEELARRRVGCSFDVVSNPEFLREGSAVQDFTHPDRVVIGADRAEAREAVKQAYRSLYLNETPFFETSLETAEMIKYAANAFLAMKITFINEIANLCEKVGADVLEVARAIGRDGRIGPKFLHPGPGYGGSCFPKDTKALAKIARESLEPVRLVEAVIDSNERQKARMVEKIDAGLSGAAGKTIAILGLAFKPNTDDMREAPSVTICTGLATRGAFLRVWDPAAMNEAAWRLKAIKDRTCFARDEYDAVKGADAVVILTEWNQFRNLDLDRMRQVMKAPVFFDLRNIYRRAQLEGMGFTYSGVGQ